MKILHLCLTSFYVDGYGYQENILPKMHKIQDHNVAIIASTETFIDNVHLGYVKSQKYENEDGIPVSRIDYVGNICPLVAHKLRIYKHLYDEIEQFKPEVIFIHGAQFLSIKSVVKYLKNNTDVKVFVDGHGDFRNSAKNFLSKWFLHGIIYRYCIKSITPYTIKFYGTLPARVEFFTDFYGTPKSKTDFLPMGADDEQVVRAKKEHKRQEIRSRFNIEDNDFLIVSGGKFSTVKREIIELMKAVKEVTEGLNSKVKMLVFGSLESGDFTTEFNTVCDGVIIQHVGWINSRHSYDYFEAADLVIFPGSHSVLWEQAVGQGKPCIFKYMEGFTHVDLGGNCLFLKSVDRKEIIYKIQYAIDHYSQMLKSAQEKGLKYFSYYDIAVRSIKV